MDAPHTTPDPAIVAGMEELIAAMKEWPAALEQPAPAPEVTPERAESDDVLADAPWHAILRPSPERGGDGGSAACKPANALERGAVVDRHLVLQRLGAGGMGVVYAAYDPDLDRKVALKLLLPGIGGDKGPARLLREAQALAKLTHPNVVAIHDVGTMGEQVWLAMEFVKGKTLGAWLETPRRWREVVSAIRSAGEGLAAAHAAGLLHRDFKPDNVMVGDDGRVRVMDFGLARARPEGVSLEDDPSQPLPAVETLAMQITQAGAIVGTPGYMAPEQLGGGEVTAAADQFAFCVTLWEALYGERPFGGRTLWEVVANVLGGRRRPPPKGRAIPSRLRRACERGLSVDPQRRWPSMEALLGELRKLVAPRMRHGLVLGLTVGLTGMGAALGVPQYLEMQARCSGAGAQLEGVWDEARRQEVEDAVLGTKLSYAADTWERIEPRLDEYAQAWVGKHTEVCEATSVRGEQTEDAMELRMGCLHERQVALGAAVTVLADADATVVEKAVQLVEALPSMDRCDDLERLEQMRQRVPPPEDPQVQKEVDALREQLAGIQAEFDAGRYADALEHIGPLVQRAEALGYGPLLAEALVQRGYAQRENDMLSEAERDLEQAFTLAAEYGHDAVATKAVTGLTWVVGFRQGRHEPGLGWGKTALALSRGPEVETTAQADSLTNVGTVLQTQGKLEEALIHQQRALAIKEQALGKQHFMVADSLNNIGGVLQEQGKLEEALTQLQRALTIKEQVLGRHHFSVATTLTNIGVVLAGQGKLEDALAHYQRALAIKEQALGRHHSSVATTLVNIGVVLQKQGKPEEALTQYQRALAIFEQILGKQHSSVASTLGNIGIVLQTQGKLDEALAHQQRALAIFGQVLGNHHRSVAEVLTNIGVVLQMQGKFEEALTHYQRALAIDEQALGKHHFHVASSLSNIGNVLREQGKLEEALTHLQRALAIDEQALGKHHFHVASSLSNIGIVLQKQGKLEEALTHYERALVIFEEALGNHHASVADALGNIGLVLAEQGKLEEALAHYERALVIFGEALGNHHASVANTLSNIGHVLQEQGKLEEALTHYERALVIFEEALGNHHPYLAYPLVGLANVALDQHEFDTARVHAERAVLIREAAKVALPLLAEARFTLARALWNDRVERKRAHALAQQARDALDLAEGPGEADIDLADHIDAWLAGHRVR